MHSKLEKQINALEEEFNARAQAIADGFRERSLIPFCRRHRLTFLSGNGSWGFYRIARNQREGHGDPVHDWELKAIEPMEQTLSSDILGQPLGWFMQDVNIRDL